MGQNHTPTVGKLWYPTQNRLVAPTIRACLGVAMEIEAKYYVSGADLEVLAGMRQLGPYVLVPAPAPELQENTYFDTADGRLTAARHGLRLRRIGERALITLKGPAEVGSDAVHRRAEFEFPGSNPDPSNWPVGVARELALALTGGAPLLPRVSISTERQILHVYRGGDHVAELCLDRGVMRGGERVRAFTELEVELLPGGTAADLSALARELSEHVVLTPEPRTKLERALALL